ILRERGLRFDRREFDAALEAERERARSATLSAGATLRAAGRGSDFRELPRTEFLAWTDTQAQSRVLALSDTQLILEASPFYPEGGGQIGDSGWIRTPGGVFVVDKTQF